MERDFSLDDLKSERLQLSYARPHVVLPCCGVLRVVLGNLLQGCTLVVIGMRRRHLDRDVRSSSKCLRFNCLKCSRSNRLLSMIWLRRRVLRPTVQYTEYDPANHEEGAGRYHRGDYCLEYAPTGSGRGQLGSWVRSGRSLKCESKIRA